MHETSDSALNDESNDGELYPVPSIDKTILYVIIHSTLDESIQNTRIVNILQKKTSSHETEESVLNDESSDGELYPIPATDKPILYEIIHSTLD